MPVVGITMMVACFPYIRTVRDDVLKQRKGGRRLTHDELELRRKVIVAREEHLALVRLEPNERRSHA